jgi:uncharacterized membrane protein
MAIVQESVVIKRPAEQVYAFVTDPKNLPKWEPAILEVEQTSTGEIGVGTTYRGVNKMMGMRMKWTATVNECEPNKKWSESIISGSSRIDEQLSFDAADGGTKFTLAYDMKAGGILKLLSPMITSTTRKQLKENLNNLKRILEAQT